VRETLARVEELIGDVLPRIEQALARLEQQAG
jgi:hypothetical protein